MPDVHFDSEQMSYSTDKTSDSGCDAVCINAARIYDSCGAKDCLPDLPVIFSDENQEIVEKACSVRINRAHIITSTVDVEPVAFHRGFYAVDTMYYFAVTVDVYIASNAIPSTISGLAMYGKRVVLYGSDGSVKTFASDDEVVCDKNDCACSCDCSNNLPRATVQISNPMALSAKIDDCRKCGCAMPCAAIPECVKRYFGCDLVHPKHKAVVATIGIFTITQLERNVQIMIPSYDFCVPRKECAAKTDDPCEVFSKIEFPTDSFFPPKAGECEKDTKPFECECNN